MASKEEKKRLEEQKKAARKEYLEKKTNFLAKANDPYADYIRVYGPNPTLPNIPLKGDDEAKRAEYDNIKIDIDEIIDEMEFESGDMKKEYAERIKKELDETTIAAIVLGACMNPQGLDKAMSASSTMGKSMLGANQMRFTDDVMTADARAVNFVPVMIERRKEAKESIINYIKLKDPSGIKQNLQYLADYAIKESDQAVSSWGMSNNVGMEANKVAYLLGSNMLEKKAFGIEANESADDIGIIRAESFRKQMEAAVLGESIKMALINNFDNLEQQERESFVTDMLFNAYIANMSNVLREERYKVDDTVASPFLQKLGIDIYNQHLEDGEVFADDVVVNNILHTHMPYVLDKHTISDFDCILAKPDGEEKLKALYIDSIKNSDIYKKIMKSKNKDQLLDNIMESDNITGHGITSIEEVKLPNESKAINERHEISYKNEMKELKDKLLDRIYTKEDMLADNYKKYGFTDMFPAGIAKNAGNIAELYSKIEKNNSRGGSKNNNYKNMMDKLKALRDYSKKLADGKEYMSSTDYASYKNLVEEVDKLAENYLDNKTNINSDYARARVKGVRELRGALSMMMKPAEATFEKVQEMKIKETFGEMYKTYKDTDPWHSPDNPFYVGKYADSNARKVNSSYTVERAAGISVTIFAMAASGKYSFEDIMDNSKLRDEKAKLAAEVIERMNNMTPENQEWIAKQIYEGQKATEAMIEQEAKRVDFSDPNILKDKHFCQMLHMSFHQFDAWQEMKNCSEEIVALANKEHPEITTYEQFKNYWTSKDTPLLYINTSISGQMSNAYDMITAKDGLSTCAARTANTTACIKKTLADLAAAQKAGVDKPLRDWIPEETQMETQLIPSGIGQMPFQKLFRFIDNSPSMSKALAPMIVDGTLFKDTKLNVNFAEGKVTLENAPTEEQMKEKAIEVANNVFLSKTDAALARMVDINYTYSTTQEYIKDCAYAMFGQMYRASGGYSPRDFESGEKMTLEDYAAKMITNKDFINSLKSKENPKKFMSPKTVAATANDQEKLKSIIAENTKKYEDMKKARELQSQRDAAKKNKGKQVEAAPKGPAMGGGNH